MLAEPRAGGPRTPSASPPPRRTAHRGASRNVPDASVVVAGCRRRRVCHACTPAADHPGRQEQRGQKPGQGGGADGERDVREVALSSAGGVDDGVGGGRVALDTDFVPAVVGDVKADEGEPAADARRERAGGGSDRAGQPREDTHAAGHDGSRPRRHTREGPWSGLGGDHPHRRARSLPPTIPRRTCATGEDADPDLEPSSACYSACGASGRWSGKADPAAASWCSRRNSRCRSYWSRVSPMSCSLV